MPTACRAAVAVPAVASVVLLALAAPALAMRTGFPNAGDDPTSTTHRRAYDLLAEGFGPGVNAPLLLVADLRSPGVDAPGNPALAAAVSADPGVAMSAAAVRPAGDTVVLPVIPTTAPADPDTRQRSGRVRASPRKGSTVTGPPP